MAVLVRMLTVSIGGALSRYVYWRTNA